MPRYLLMENVPMLLAEDGRRLSKRDRDLDLGELRQRISPEQLIGCLAYSCGLIDQRSAISAKELAKEFLQKANEFKSSIWVEKDERRVNAKSLLGVLSLGIMGGTDIKIMAGGSDEEEAVDALVALVESGFAE